MSDTTPTTKEKSSPDEAAAPTLRAKISSLVNWSGAGRLHKLLLGTAAAIGLVGLFAFWSYLGHVTVVDVPVITLDMAWEALDQQKYEEARNIIVEIQRNPKDLEDFGSYLYILGAVKSYQADKEWSDDRKRATHLIAARYLQKARDLGVPEDREGQLIYLLGQSLVYGNQSREGIAILQEALKELSDPPIQLRRLLVEAYLNLPNPKLHEALEHNRFLISEPSLATSERAEALLTQSHILINLGNLEKAKLLLETLNSDEGLQAAKRTLSGRLALAQARISEPNSAERSSLLENALQDFREALRQDKVHGKVRRQAMVFVGECYELKNDLAAAIVEYENIGNSYGDTAESIVATLEKARLLQQTERPDKALVAYRAVLESVGEPVTYVNSLLPLAQLRRNLLQAHSRFVEDRNFEQALALVDHLTSLFEPTTVTELRGITHVVWGEASLDEASKAQRRRSTESLETEGRYHFRAAGRAFQSLAEMRFATSHYTNDLWKAAENYYRGHSYTQTALVLDEYLHHEARTRRALALLRYGQSQLAAGETAKAITALEECIEMHPRDASVYAARVACAQAFLSVDQPDKAEALLVTNITGDTLRPESPEWRESLFLLGTHLHDSGKYDESIKVLEEAVARYPMAPQALVARYTIARSFHSASEEPAKKAREAKTENERQKNRKSRDQNLESALENYLDVQRKITLGGHADDSPMNKALLRNCYMMQGSVLFELRRYEEARKAYANVSTLYQHEPFVLESFVHIANCWHRLNQPLNARQTIAQAKLVLERLQTGIDFKQTTNFSRQQWELLLNEMAQW
ncbi:tetratricopeptide repeat protein [Bythopirellula goksoeyrii]|uniref:Tetratricopeptide repeat protein n=1 Tax=Bythopirellula goksoeyrii TaxID=1400387 RepID=A0A5B9QFM7_9BACT|nr:tetratricopeptide repeat protein [Bythopirellula goksoeyrii]QEG33063.1 Tetratricopeptide repeat protein [Bythopirellula goksoeyrii]